MYGERGTVPCCRVYAIQVADTVLVNQQGTSPEVLTRFSASDWNAVCYEVKSEAEEDDSEVSGDVSGSDIDDMDSNPKRCLLPKLSWLALFENYAPLAMESAELNTERCRYVHRYSLREYLILSHVQC
jgi:hypothetical protein